MTIILQLEHMGVIRKKVKIPYAMKYLLAEKWKQMYPCKDVVIFYTLESRMNYEQQLSPIKNII